MNACPATRCRRAALALLGLALLPLAQAADPPPPPRPGYLIVIGNGVDPARLRDYGIQAGKLVARHGGRLLFATQEGQTEILEGGPFPGSIRVFEFPSVEAVRAFYRSAEYQQAIELRRGNGRFDLLVADSIAFDPRFQTPSAVAPASPAAPTVR